MCRAAISDMEECNLYYLKGTSDDISGYKGLQVGIPACTRLKWGGNSKSPCPPFSSANLQFLDWGVFGRDSPISEAALKSLHDFLLNSSRLQDLKISIPHYFGLESLIQLIFCDSLEQGIWKNIRSVEVTVSSYSGETSEPFFNQMVGRKQHYEKGWKEFMVSKDGFDVKLQALL